MQGKFHKSLRLINQKNKGEDRFFFYSMNYGKKIFFTQMAISLKLNNFFMLL